MKIEERGWEGFAAFLFVEKKLNDNIHNQQTLKSRFKTVARYFKDNDLNFKSFNQFLYERKQAGYKPTSLNNLTKIVKHYGEYCQCDEFKKLGYYKEVRSEFELLNPEEIKSLAEVEVDYKKCKIDNNLRYKTLIYFLALLGCRIQEALNLKWLDIKHNTICYTATFRDTKNGDNRTVPIPSFVYDLLDKLPKKELLVFNSYRGNAMAEPQINADLKRRAELAGIKKRVFCHLFRHSFITTLIKAGVPITHVSRICGHRDIKSTNYYTSLILDDLLEAQLSHPLLKEIIDFPTLSNRIKAFINKTVAKDNHIISIKEENKKLVIEIEEDDNPRFN